MRPCYSLVIDWVLLGWWTMPMPKASTDPVALTHNAKNILAIQKKHICILQPYCKCGASTAPTFLTCKEGCSCRCSIFTVQVTKKKQWFLYTKYWYKYQTITLILNLSRSHQKFWVWKLVTSCSSIHTKSHFEKHIIITTIIIYYSNIGIFCFELHV